MNPSGFLGGGQIGYNWQVHPNWVLGVEVDFSWTNADGTVAYTTRVERDDHSAPGASETPAPGDHSSNHSGSTNTNGDGSSKDATRTPTPEESPSPTPSVTGTPSS